MIASITLLSVSAFFFFGISCHKAYRSIRKTDSSTGRSAINCLLLSNLCFSILSIIVSNIAPILASLFFSVALLMISYVALGKKEGGCRVLHNWRRFLISLMCFSCLFSVIIEFSHKNFSIIIQNMQKINSDTIVGLSLSFILTVVALIGFIKSIYKNSL